MIRTAHRLFSAGCLLLVLASALHAASEAAGGGDTWVALAAGRYQLGSWAVDQPDRTWQMRLLDRLGVHITQRDPFSDHSRPYDPGRAGATGWINQNWLSHVTMYLLFPADAVGGTRGNPLVYYKFCLVLLTALLVYATARVLGAHPGIAAPVTAFGILLGRSFLDLRPNVSSLLLAAAMMLVLACWRRGRHGVLACMVPIMLVWANVHGGFIYAILVFALVAAGQVIQQLLDARFPDRFATTTPRGLTLLLATAVAVLLIPAIFSPFGWQNLSHPLLVAMGDEGARWRLVAEWLPLWDARGYGNTGPYLAFLAMLVGVFGVWTALLARSASYRPRIDLGYLAVVLATLLMSIQSRRFVPFGGVIIAPFLAAMIQEAIDMRLALRGAPARPTALPDRWAWPAAVLALLGVLAIAAIFVRTMRQQYLAPIAAAEGRSTLFTHMVAISGQPVRPMEFIRALPFRGRIYNRWTHGGYVAFWQEPVPDTGEPGGKIYIDGRAQAAYEIEHYERTSRLVSYATVRPGHAPSPAEFAAALADDDLNIALLETGDVADPTFPGSGREAHRLLLASGKWMEAYPGTLTTDPRWAILLRTDHPLNQELLEVLQRVEIVDESR